MYSLPSRGQVLLEEHIVLVRERLDQISRTSGLPHQTAEEFRAWALHKLIENDYRILASWEGRSSLSTYLNVALANLLREHRIHIHQKTVLRAGEEDLQKIEVDGCVEKRALNGERSRIGARLREELVPGLRALPAEERLLLKMCFRDGFTIADIAPILGRSQKELCSIRDRCLRKLRKALKPLGLSSGQVLGLVSSPLSELWEAWND